MTEIEKELWKARVEKDLKDIDRIIKKLNALCIEESDMGLAEFLLYKIKTEELKKLI